MADIDKPLFCQFPPRLTRGRPRFGNGALFEHPRIFFVIRYEIL